MQVFVSSYLCHWHPRGSSLWPRESLPAWLELWVCSLCPGCKGLGAPYRGEEMCWVGERVLSACRAVAWFSVAAGAAVLQQGDYRHISSAAMGLCCHHQGVRFLGADTVSVPLTLCGAIAQETNHDLSTTATLAGVAVSTVVAGKLHLHAQSRPCPSLSPASPLRFSTSTFWCTMCGSLRHGSMLSRETFVGL